MEQRRPENYLVFAILSTVLCCMPAGVVSIVYAAKVNGLFAEGRFDEAEKASKNAKMWAIISASIGLVGLLLYFIFIGVAVVAGN